MRTIPSRPRRSDLTAQVLLTRQDFADRRRYVNARQTLLALLAAGVVPVINENDTIATEEIRSDGPSAAHTAGLRRPAALRQRAADAARAARGRRRAGDQ